jgi:hypothetical protein
MMLEKYRLRGFSPIFVATYESYIPLCHFEYKLLIRLCSFYDIENRVVCFWVVTTFSIECSQSADFPIAELRVSDLGMLKGVFYGS